MNWEWSKFQRGIYRETLTKYNIMKWKPFNIRNSKSYPNEGEHLLVSDGINVDVAYFVMSGEYQFHKQTSVSNDTFSTFDSFEVTRWTTITE